ncbi:MAG TPA: winged helix DNA-binding domain-containing protein [Vicinamibacterales bacterium]|nr:winged helix DNA-binding domain-containing protein [Vicinamibacterales bacterium]
MRDSVLRRRLANQRIEGPGHRRPADVVSWFGAVQAQEYEAAKWGLGLRMSDGVGESDVERALDEGRILRTHVLRPTWHFVTPADIRWMLALTGSRVQKRLAVYWRQMSLDRPTLTRGTSVIERALGDRGCLTRGDLADALRRAKLPLVTHRLAHLALYAETEGVICSGPRRGKQSTYALLTSRAPRAPRLDRDEALGLLVRRFFQSHGPATIRDFVWWSGLTTPDATRGLDIVKASREYQNGRTYWRVGPARPTTRERLAHLLPIYDEYLVAYKDREAIPHSASKITSAYGRPVNFQHAVIVDGRVVGTWRVTRSARAIAMRATMLRRLTARERRAIADAAKRYERFQGIPVELTID